jgi:hypothetical protein
MKASLTDIDELSGLASPGSVGSQVSSPSLDRRAVRDRRWKERRLRRMYALGGLSVLAAILVATIVVVDMVR